MMSMMGKKWIIISENPTESERPSPVRKKSLQRERGRRAFLFVREDTSPVSVLFVVECAPTAHYANYAILVSQNANDHINISAYQVSGQNGRHMGKRGRG